MGSTLLRIGDRPRGRGCEPLKGRASADQYPVPSDRSPPDSQPGRHLDEPARNSPPVPVATRQRVTAPAVEVLEARALLADGITASPGPTITGTSGAAILNVTVASYTVTSSPGAPAPSGGPTSTGATASPTRQSSPCRTRPRPSTSPAPTRTAPPARTPSPS